MINDIYKFKTLPMRINIYKKTHNIQGIKVLIWITKSTWDYISLNNFLGLVCW